MGAQPFIFVTNEIEVDCMKLRTMFLFLLMMCVAVIASAQNGPNPMIFQPNENMYGLSYGDWKR